MLAEPALRTCAPESLVQVKLIDLYIYSIYFLIYGSESQTNGLHGSIPRSTRCIHGTRGRLSTEYSQHLPSS